MNKAYLILTLCLISTTTFGQSYTNNEIDSLQPRSIIKGGWIIECSFPTTIFELFETRTESGLSLYYYNNVEYCFSNHYAIVAEIAIDNYRDSNNSEIDKSLEFALRRYFLKKSNLFIGIGCQIGNYSKSAEKTFVTNYNYIRPRIEVGYEYLITDLHPIVDTRLGIVASMYSLVPAKTDNNMEITVFPAIKVKVGFCYHL